MSNIKKESVSSVIWFSLFIISFFLPDNLHLLLGALFIGWFGGKAFGNIVTALTTKDKENNKQQDALYKKYKSEE